MVRQAFIYRLHEQWGYLLDQIRHEVRIQSGRGWPPDRWGVAGGRPCGSLTSAAGRLSLACRLAQRASGGRTSRPPHRYVSGVAFSNRSLAAGIPGMG